MYISVKLEEVKKQLKELCKTASSEECAFYGELFGVVTDLANQVDIMSVRMEELEQKSEAFEMYTERLSASLQSLRDCIVGDVTVDTDAYTSEYDEREHSDDECDCGHEHCGHDCDCCDGCDDEEEYDEGYEDFFTVQCPFCQEVFFVERSEYEDNIECPLCNHTVPVMDNLLDIK